MKKLFTFYLTLCPFVIQAQNWQAFSGVDTVLYEVKDAVLGAGEVLPLIEGINGTSADLAMNPLYGIRVTSYSESADSTKHWQIKPVNNLLYDNPFMPYPGRCPLKDVWQKNDSISIQGESHSFSIFLDAIVGNEYLAGTINNLNVFLRLDSIFAYDDNGNPDSLAEYTSMVYDQNMASQPNHHLHGKNLLTISKNKGLVKFPDMHFINVRLVPFEIKEYQEPLLEDIIKFDVGDLFWFRNSTYSSAPMWSSLNLIIEKQETDSSFVYTEAITRQYTGEVTYNQIYVPKNKPLRSVFQGGSMIPMKNSPLQMDSLAHGQESGITTSEWTYMHGPDNLQGRKVLYSPNYLEVIHLLELTNDEKMYVEGVGYLYKRCMMIPSNNPPYHVEVCDSKILVAYEKMNGDNYGIIPENWDVETHKISSFKIAPNPCQAKLSVFNSSNEMAKASLIDMFGKTILGDIELKAGASNLIDIAYLPGGIYFLRIALPNGGVVTEKIIKQN